MLEYEGEIKEGREQAFAEPCSLVAGALGAFLDVLNASEELDVGACQNAALPVSALGWFVGRHIR
ncbi:hypothetical protein DMJ13_27295 [halophilic archaeon]|nr:hypothetical protein DMJ13_27295 [halophilic archaeon]